MDAEYCHWSATEWERLAADSRRYDSRNRYRFLLGSTAVILLASPTAAKAEGYLHICINNALALHHYVLSSRINWRLPFDAYRHLANWTYCIKTRPYIVCRVWVDPKSQTTRSWRSPRCRSAGPHCAPAWEWWWEWCSFAIHLIHVGDKRGSIKWFTRYDWIDFAMTFSV